MVLAIGEEIRPPQPKRVQHIAGLTPGERQLCLVLQAKQLATVSREDEAAVLLIDLAFHERLLESLARPGISLRAAVPHEAAG